MSLKPGIGTFGLKNLINFFHTREGCAILSETGDVPSFIRWENQKWPIGRYLKSVLRVELGFTDPKKTPEVIIAAIAGKNAALLEQDLAYFDSIREQDALKAERKHKLQLQRERL